MRKRYVVSLLLFIVAIILAIGHSRAIFSATIERLFDVILAVILIAYYIANVKMAKVDKKHMWAYIIIANLALMLGISHILRLLNGGLPC